MISFHLTISTKCGLYYMDGITFPFLVGKKFSQKHMSSWEYLNKTKWNIFFYILSKNINCFGQHIWLIYSAIIYQWYFYPPGGLWWIISLPTKDNYIQTASVTNIKVAALRVSPRFFTFRSPLNLQMLNPPVVLYLYVLICKGIIPLLHILFLNS